MTRQPFLSPDFSAEIEYKPKLAALQAENEALWKLLRELTQKVMESPDLAEFMKDGQNQSMMVVALSRDFSSLIRLSRACYKAWTFSDEQSLDKGMSDVEAFLYDFDLLDGLEDETEGETNE